ncbi:hypothetical protein L9F63_002135, partial [Diploptera punctata]
DFFLWRRRIGAVVESISPNMLTKVPISSTWKLKNFETPSIILEHGVFRIGNLPFSLRVPIPGRANMVTRTKKIFVGGLSAPTTLEDVKNYFEQFGPHQLKTKY